MSESRAMNFIIILLLIQYQFPTTEYRKLGNFHVEIIHAVNIHVDLFSWVYGTHENILT